MDGHVQKVFLHYRRMLLVKFVENDGHFSYHCLKSILLHAALVSKQNLVRLLNTDNFWMETFRIVFSSRLRIWYYNFSLVSYLFYIKRIIHIGILYISPCDCMITCRQILIGHLNLEMVCIFIFNKQGFDVIHAGILHYNGHHDEPSSLCSIL